MATCLRQRHGNGCRRRGRCEPPWEAAVFDAAARRKVRKTFPTRAAARSWRQDAQVAIRQGKMQASTTATVAEVAEAWLVGAEAGTITASSGSPYAASSVRAYERALRLRVLPALGSRPLCELRRTEIQRFADEIADEDYSASTIHTTVAPLRALCRREVTRGRLEANPTRDLDLPAVRNGRDRIAHPAEAKQLLTMAPECDRAIWATAIYAGLRRGELMALRVDDIDLSGGIVRVERGWDDKEGVIPTKSHNRRRVPIAGALREYLLPHLMRTGRRNRDLVFGSTATSPFSSTRLTARADKAWRAAGLERITLHEGRHTYASLMIAAGANAKALSTYMGHARIAITLDLYGHLMPGNEAEAADLLDAYLERAKGAATG